jgi:hypothetical protein
MTENIDERTSDMPSEAEIAIVRRNTEEVQSRGNLEMYDEFFDSNFVDRTLQPGVFPADRDGARNSCGTLPAEFPDFYAAILWHVSDGDRLTRFKTHHGTHVGLLANTQAESTGRYAMEPRCHVTLMKDAIAAFSKDRMNAAHELNGPNFADVILTTAELIAMLPTA